LPRFILNVADLIRRVLVLARPYGSMKLGLFSSLSRRVSAGSNTRHGVLPRVTAAEPQNRAIDQVPQFVVGIRIFYE